MDQVLIFTGVCMSKRRLLRGCCLFVPRAFFDLINMVLCIESEYMMITGHCSSCDL